MSLSWAKLKQGAKPSRETALALLGANMSVPGAGTILSGSKVAGTIQLVIALAGFAVSTIFGIKMLLWMMSNWERLHSPDGDPLAMFTETWQIIRLPLAGLLIFGFAWVWSLGSSLAYLRRFPKTSHGRVPPPL